MMRFPLPVLLAMLLGLATAVAPAQEEASRSRPAAIPPAASLDVATLAGQLLIPAITPRKVLADPERWAEIETWIQRDRIGGLHLFRARVDEVREVLRRAQAIAAVPLLITADMEGGAGYVYRGATRFPRGMGLAATGDPELARRVAEATAREGEALGIHVNFHPVVDVNVNAKNPIINLRSFGEDPQLVARFGRAYVEGTQRAGVIATAKHFPGHGDTTQDSHLALPVVDAPRKRLDRVELPPFRAAIDAGVGAIMSAHIAWPRVTGDSELPATLSSQILRGLLRKEMGFKGIVFSDALNMKGITKRFPDLEASEMAVKAGIDVLLFPSDVPRITQRFRRALRTGDDRRLAKGIRAAATRIVEAKQALAMRRTSWGGAKDWRTRLRTEETQALADEVVARSLTRLASPGARWPLAGPKGRRILHVVAKDPGQDFWDGPAGVPFGETLTALGAAVQSCELAADASNLPEILEQARGADEVIVTAHNGVAAFRGRSGVSEKQREALSLLGKRGAVLVGFGNPYGLAGLSSFTTILLAYDLEPREERVAAKSLFLTAKPTGRLPVTVPGLRARR